MRVFFTTDPLNPGAKTTLTTSNRGDGKYLLHEKVQGRYKKKERAIRYKIEISKISLRTRY